jgi:uncharacterized protein
MRSRVLRVSDYVRMPWKNGLGTTLELAREPAGTGDFRWRLSLASVSSDGPFSAYPDHQRVVALVSGEGFVLNVNGVASRPLDAAGAHIAFDGGATTTCRLIGGPCTDLSLMVREPGRIMYARCLGVGSSRVELDRNSLHALFAVHGAARVEVPGDGDMSLAERETLLLPSEEHVRSLRVEPAPGAILLHLAWC